MCRRRPGILERQFRSFRDDSVYISRLEAVESHFHVQKKLLAMFAQAQNRERGLCPGDYIEGDVEMVWSEVEPCLSATVYDRTPAERWSLANATLKGTSNDRKTSRAHRRHRKYAGARRRNACGQATKDS